MVARSTRRRRARIGAVLAASACVASLAAGAWTPAQAQAPAQTQLGAGEVQPGPQDAGGITPPRSNAPSRVPADHVPTTLGRPVASDPSAKFAEGLTMKDTRTAANGNQFSLEPPDQALCVGDTEVIEGVNNVFATYDKTSGAQTSAPQAYDPFWNGVYERDRTNHTYGPFISDPKCYFDPDLHRFFMTELQVDTNSANGAFAGASYVNVAVSKTAAPSTSSDDWYLYKIVTTNDGSDAQTPVHPSCPCFGDQPLIGADANGFYISTNEFNFAGNVFNGAQIYALNKHDLAAGVASPRMQRIEQANRPLAEGVAYSVQLATSPDAAEWSSANNGTEYAMSALEFTGKLDNRIAVWALTNTNSLNSTPAIGLTHKVLTSEVYGAPPMAQQPAGPYPLGQSLKDAENLINTNDDRMNQVVYSGGNLWGGLNSAVRTPNGPTRSGIAYFVVQPTSTDTSVDGTVTNQGYVSVNRNSLMYPSIAVAPGGTKATMVFSMSGSDFYPSTAYIRMTAAGAATGPVQIYAAGTKPADGFTGYPQYGGNGVERWGDYSAAVADTDGNMFTATEYIPGTYGAPFLANWGTAIGEIH